MLQNLIADWKEKFRRRRETDKLFFILQLNKGGSRGHLPSRHPCRARFGGFDTQ
jgi:hypothetical protein